MEKDNYSKKALHTRLPEPDPYGSLSMPVYNTLAFEYDSAEAMELAFTGKSNGFVYSRISNPTVFHFEEKIRAISGASSVTALNSGMAAISNAVLTLVQSGSNIITTRHLFGNTYSFFNATLAGLGVETRFCNLGDFEQVEAAMDQHTAALFLEIISNPQMEVADLVQLATIAHRKGIPVIADTTLIPPSHFKAAEWGIDIEVISSTKYISGGGASLGGLILDYGNFNWANSATLALLAEQHGTNAFTFRLKREIHRNLGAYMTPQVAYQQLIGLESMELRYRQSSATAAQLAQYLSKANGVCCVNYNGLPENPYYELSNRQFGTHPGAMLTFDLGSKEACFKWMNNLKLIRRATNLFDNKTLAIHPYTTIYGSYSPEAKAFMHIYDTTIRLSVGLEHIDDLIEDIQQALSY